MARPENEVRGLPLRRAIDWGELAPLRLRAIQVADGLFAGPHRSARRGAGVEFAGHRVYVPGDELRFVDPRASMRHERIVVRHFETETERALRVVLDATLSMAFRSKGAPASKLAYGALIAAALARVALRGHDPVGLDLLGGSGSRRVPPSAASETFERVLGSLESLGAEGDARSSPDLLDAALEVAVRGARRGSAIVILSDFLDLPEGAESSLSALGTRGRAVVLVQILDPEEVSFPFEGPVVLRAMEGAAGEQRVVQTDGPTVRDAYLRALEARTEVFRGAAARHGGALLRAVTTDDPIEVTRNVFRAIASPATAENPKKA
ncbi:MAG: DUF58 domain-containing protein [Myxococcales bacterium]|nr:DUF58 domain-containing protein [Myxococcales bacterium]